MTLADLSKLAAEMAEMINAQTADPKRSVLLCGMIAARIAAGPGQNIPGESPNTYAKLLVQGFSAAMTIETAGLVDQSNRTHLGMAG